WVAMVSNKLKQVFFIWLLLVVASTATAAQMVDRIAVMVDGDPITESEVAAATTIVGHKMGTTVTDVPTKVLRRQVLDDLIMRTLRRQKAQQMGIKITEPEVDRVFANVARSNQLTPEQLLATLKKERIELQNYRQELRDQLIQLHLVNQLIRPSVSISEEELRAFYYQGQPQKSRVRVAEKSEAVDVEQVRVGHILIAQGRNDPEEQIRQKQALSEQLLAQLEQGRPFAALASQHSDDPVSRNKGGEIGWFKRGEMPKNLEDAAFGLYPGQYSQPLRSPQGWHILILYEKHEPSSSAASSRGERQTSEPSLPPLDLSSSQKDQLRQQILDAKVEVRYRQWLRDLRLRAFVEEPKR
ncbi:MAG: peptidylprolyl isomerase, partial [Magnetococcales bacterium]|nr:peptidylprolyl isomerase [Magnetococcales bacterium]